MRQKILDLAHRLRGQTVEDVPQVGKRIVPVELCRLDQTHHSGRTSPRSWRSRKEPVPALMPSLA